MKLKTLALSVGLLAVLSALAYFSNRAATGPAADPRVGQPLLDPAVASAATRLVVSDRGTTVTIERSPDGRWRVPAYFGLPADFSKVSRFVSDLTESKVGRFVSANPDTLARLEFKDTRLRLQDDAGKDLWSVTLGKTSDSGSGRFVRFGDAAPAYLCDLRAWIDNDPKAWADTQIADVNADDVAKISIPLSDGPPLTISRAKKDSPWVALGSSAARPVRSDAVASLLSTLGSLRFSDTTAVDDPAAAEARRHLRTCTLTTFSGTTWTFDFGQKPAGKLPGQSPALPAPALADAGTPPPPPNPVFAFVSCSDTGAAVNALMRQRAFQIDDSTFGSLPNKESDVLAPR